MEVADPVEFQDLVLAEMRAVAERSSGAAVKAAKKNAALAPPVGVRRRLRSEIHCVF